MTAAPRPGVPRWWKVRRSPDADVVEPGSVVDVIDLRPSALEEWERSAGLVEYPSDLKDWCADRRRGSDDPGDLVAGETWPKPGTLGT